LRLALVVLITASTAVPPLAFCASGVTLASPSGPLGLFLLKGLSYLTCTSFPLPFLAPGGRLTFVWKGLLSKGQTWILVCCSQLGQDGINYFLLEQQSMR